MTSATEKQMTPEAIDALQDENRRLHDQVTALRSSLHECQRSERERLTLLSKGIRQELQGIVGLNIMFEALMGESENETQQAILTMVSQKGQNILHLVEQLCEVGNEYEAGGDKL